MSRSRGLESRLALARIIMSTLWHRFSDSVQNLVANRRNRCGDAFPIEGVLVATYLLSVEALPHCRCGVANKSYMV